MKNVVTEADVDALPVQGADFDAIIPAAGLGSRLGHHAPKVLYPVLGRPILHWLLDLLEPHCKSIVRGVSPGGRDSIADELARSGREANVALAVQSAPRGMADAVLAARNDVKREHALVVWGDQVALTPRTIGNVVRLHGARPTSTLTLATILRKAPYIHVERDAEERIVHVHEARKSPIDVPVGENDCGIFAFRTRTLFEILEKAAAEPRVGECDLLPLFPRFETGHGTVATMRITDPMETIGVNTPADAEALAAVLKGRRT